jgi:Mn2+/Fe2+ NRAMP family transporter
MTIAGFVNLAMMATAAAASHFTDHSGIAAGNPCRVLRSVDED